MQGLPTPPEGAVMTETTNKEPVKTEKTPASAQARRPFQRLRGEIDSLFEDFFGGRRRPVAPSWT